MVRRTLLVAWVKTYNVTDYSTFYCCSEYVADIVVGNSNKSISVLLDPGSTPILTGPGLYNGSGPESYLGENSTECQSFVGPGYGILESSNGQCIWYSSYLDGSEMRGSLVNDSLVLVTQQEGGNVTLQAVFGLTDTTDDPLGSNSDDGIFGVDRGSQSLLTQLHKSEYIDERVFGQCGTSTLQQNGSFGVFGSYLPSSTYQTTPLYTGKEMYELKGFGEEYYKEAAKTSLDTSGYYVFFSGVEIDGGQRIENASYSPLPIMFDSGTSSIRLPEAYFDGIVASIKKNVASLEEGAFEVVESQLPQVGKAVLVVPTSGVLDPSVVPDIFPNITILLGYKDPIKVTLPPESYVISAEFEGTQGFSVKIAALGSSELLGSDVGLNLGVPFVYDRFVQLNDETSEMKVSDLTPGCDFPKTISSTVPPSKTNDSVVASSGSIAFRGMYMPIVFSILLRIL